MDRTLVHRKIYVLLLCLLAVAMTTSVFFANLFWFLLLVNWVAEWNWREKFINFRSNYLLQAFVTLLLVHLLWMFGGGNWSSGWSVLETGLPLWSVPLVVLTTPRLGRRNRHLVISVYVTTVLIVSVIGWIRGLTIKDLPYREMVPFVSHIRFALNVCLVICLVLCYAVRRMHQQPRAGILTLCLSLLIVVWLTYFLLLIQSYTAFLLLGCLLFVASAWAIYRIHTVKGRVLVTSIFVVAIAGCSFYLYTLRADYYRPTLLECQPLASFTAQGNPYSHACDGLIESGGQVNNYICEQELRSTWPLVSTVDIDSLTPNGYAVYPTLVRYLGSCGLTKDSVGVAQLSQQDVRAIESGIANHVFVDGSAIRKMVYRLLFEYETYRITGSVRNSSIGDRVLLWQNAWQVFCQHPLLGVGTCNAFDACHEHLQETHSPLAGTQKNIHSQYLSFLVSFGLLGFLLIVFAFARAAFFRWQPWPFSLVAYVCIVLFSFIGETTLGTLAGILFCTLPISFLGDSED